MRVGSLYARPRLPLLFVGVAVADEADVPEDEDTLVVEAAIEVMEDFGVLEGVVVEAVVGFVVPELVEGFAVVDGVGIVEVILLVIVETLVDLIVLVVVLQVVAIFLTEHDEVPSVKVEVWVPDFDILVQLHDVTGCRLVDVVVVNLVEVMVVMARGAMAGIAPTILQKRKQDAIK